MAADMDETAVASVFRALADPTRRQILRALRKGELAAGDIASRFPISGPSVSRHLAVLKAAGLVTERREANRVMYSARRRPLWQLRRLFPVGRVWPGRVLGRHQGKKKTKAPDKAARTRPVPPRKQRPSRREASGKGKHRRGSSQTGPGQAAHDGPAQAARTQPRPTTAPAPASATTRPSSAPRFENGGLETHRLAKRGRSPTRAAHPVVP